MPIQKEYNRVLMPLVTGFSTLLWGKTVLELVTRGGIHSPDLMADSYLAVMLTYASAGEVEKWGTPGAWDPHNDPWVERAQRGGFFLLLWSVPFFAAYLWRLADTAVPFPAELKQIWTGLFTIFLAKNASRSLRHRRKGVYFDPSEPAGASLSLEDEIPVFIARQPNQTATTTEVCAQFSTLSRRHITRVLGQLVDGQRLARHTDPQTREASYSSPKKEA